MKPRIGLVGAGMMGAAHLRSWRAVGVEPVGVVAENGDLANAFAQAHGVRAFASFEALLDVCSAVDLCVPTDLHAPLTLHAAERGLDVVCEKPLARTIADGRAMIDACRRHGVLLLVAQVLRFFPPYRRAHELIASGALGPLTRLELRRASSVPPGSWYRDTRRSGGLALDLLVHDVDYACSLLGRPSEVRREVGPHHATTRPHDAGAGPHDADGAETVRLHLRWPDGASAVIDGSWDLPGATTGFRIEGDAGALWSEGGRLYLERRTPAGDDRACNDRATEIEVDATGPYELQARHLLRALEREAPFEVDAEEALLAVEVCTHDEP